MMENNEYRMRGQRVQSVSPDQIEKFVKRSIKVLGLNKQTFMNMDIFIDELWHKYGVIIEPIEDHEWLGYVDAVYDPNQFTIAMPNILYNKLVKHNDDQAFFILFHELGHLLLGHRAVLHHATVKPTQYEDSEWQADYFSEMILKSMGRKNYKQLSFDFE